MASDIEYTGTQPTSPLRTAEADAGARTLHSATLFDDPVGAGREFARGRCNWYGVCGMDYMFYVANHHPLLSIFLCHALNPYCKLERVFVFIIITALSVPPSVFLVLVLTEEGAPAFASQAVVIYIVTGPIMCVQYLVELLVVADAFVETETGGWRDSIAGCVRSMKDCCLCITLVLTSVVFAIFLVILKRQDINVEYALWPLVISRLQSWLLWFALMLLMPCRGFLWRWHRERESPPLT